jgi:SHS2 domain-containing protein
LKGQSIDPTTHEIERVVKAVTYHGLEVKKKKKSGWSAKVILDL